MIRCIPSVPNCVITNLKINNFKDNESTTIKNVRHIFLHYQSDVHFSTKINTYTFYKGVAGSPLRNKRNKKKSKQIDAFPLPRGFKVILKNMFYFLAGLLNVCLIELFIVNDSINLNVNPFVVRP